MTPCGDNASACAASCHVTQSSPKRGDVSLPGAPALLADYYVRPNEAGKEEKDGPAMERLPRENVERIEDEKQTRESEHSVASPHSFGRCCAAPVTTSPAPKIPILFQPKDNANQPLDLTTSKRPHSNGAKDRTLSPLPSMQNPYADAGFNNGPYAAFLPLYTPTFNNDKLQAQLCALAYLQSKQFMAAQQQQAVQEYDKQKWITAIREQQIASMRQVTKTPRKRTISDGFMDEPQRKRATLEPYSGGDGAGIRQASRSPGSSILGTNSGKRYKRYAKPPYSYVALITLAILSSPQKKLRLNQILKRISEMFPFFQGHYQGWRDSVRHNLSQNECFQKVLKNPSRPTAKGNYWSVNTSSIPRDLMARQNTHVSRVVQDNGYSYRKDLTEVFDCRSGNIKVDIPQSLFRGTDLIEEPAAVMDRLLLEPKNDGEPLRPNDGRLGKIYSLVDMFNQDDFFEDSLARSNNGAHWSGSPKARHVSPQPLGLVPASKPEQVRSENPLPQNELLARALTGQIPPSPFPLIQALYNNYLQNMNGMGHLGLPSGTTQQPNNLSASHLSQSGVGSVTSNSVSPFDISDSGSDDEARKWGQEAARSPPRHDQKASILPFMLRSPAFHMQQSPEQRTFSSVVISDETPKVAQGTVKGLFTAFSARPLET